MEPVKYVRPQRWIRFDRVAVLQPLAEARGAMQALAAAPFQRAWVERLRERRLRDDVRGTARIDGAELTDDEVDAALRLELGTDVPSRAQRQARAAGMTYRWLAMLPEGDPLNADLIREVHRRIVTRSDDDRAAPGRLRARGQNVTFGAPPLMGCEGGPPCEEAFAAFTGALAGEFRGHDPVVQALAAHYHLAAMHPFGDGNGRAARAVEALLLQRAGLAPAPLAMSHYYCEEKTEYFHGLAAVRAADDNLTPFLVFGLKGIARQGHRLLLEMRAEIQKVMFRDTTHDLFGRLQSRKTRPMRERQLEILALLVDTGEIDCVDVQRRLLDRGMYAGLKAPAKTAERDWRMLRSLHAVEFVQGRQPDVWRVRARLEWPAEISESEFMRRLKDLPRDRTDRFFRAWK